LPRDNTGMISGTLVAFFDLVLLDLLMSDIGVSDRSPNRLVPAANRSASTKCPALPIGG
jgi:hypothetical protein